MRRLRARSVVTEAARNARARPWPGLLAAAAALLAGLLVPSLTSLEIGALEAKAATLVTDGATVVSITAAERRPLPAAKCEELRGVEGVVAAGGTIATGTVHGADGSSVSLLRVTAGFPRVLWPGDALRTDLPASAVAGRLLAERAGLLGPGLVVGLADGEPAAQSWVDQVAGHSPRLPFADRALVVVDPAGRTVQECLVEAEPGAAAAVGALASSWFPADLQTTAAPIAPALGGIGALDAEVEGRLSRIGALLGALLCALGLAASWLAQRADIALYRSLGLSTGRLLLMLAVQAGLTTGVGVIIGLGAAVVLLPWSPLALRLAATDVAAMLALMTALPLLGAAILPRGRGLDALRGR
ncbi:hypothetical protein [Rathayibacter rathayi]|uniref:hypothetical protein n=1 Tax=Rathayibacter rathayi TaxID=33887 RepID=UPI000CE84C4D|nr:hypothetical protein [Rathayibacter rathayi]PPG90648.1 hypothetical protein C5C47_00595 [Rathayibacter rathayi]